MASKSKKAGPASVQGAAAAAELGPLPDGFVWIRDDDGHLMQPTPAKAVAELLQVLAEIPPWERFPDEPGEWTAGQRRERGRPMPGNIVVTGRDASGSRFEIEKSAEEREALLKEWERRTRAKRTMGALTLRENAIGGRLELTAQKIHRGTKPRSLRDPGHGILIEPVIRRNVSDERRELVQNLRESFGVFVPPAIVAVLAAGGGVEQLRELESDPELCADTVAAAVLELRRAAPAPKAVGAPLDIATDPMCQKIRRAVAMSPSGALALKPLVHACGGDQVRRTVQNRLRLLLSANPPHVTKSGNRGSYRLSDPTGIEQQRLD